MANKTITQLDAAQSLNDNMVIAVQDTNTTYKTTLADVKAYCGGGGDAYKVGDRVNDDSDNPVGTVSSIFTDGNGDRYAVVCLDAVNRLASGQVLSSAVTTSGIPQYTDRAVYYSPETATENTTAILATASSGGYTSSACSHCRSKTFLIGGSSYTGQLPNFIELVDLFGQAQKINTNDPTASQYSSLILSTTGNACSSNQATGGTMWYLGSYGDVGNLSKTSSCFVIPVLEIPLD